MFQSLPHTFRKHKLSADVRALLQLRKAMEKGLVNTLGDIYYVLKGLITNDPKEFGPFTAAFYETYVDRNRLIERGGVEGASPPPL